MAYDKDKIFPVILLEIEQGNSLRSILRREDMPTQKTFFDWLLNDEEKVKQYTRACDLRADNIFEEMIEIADDGRNDFMTKMIGENLEIEVLNSEHIQRSRLRIDARKWMLSKMNPKKYGERIQTEHSGEITTNIINLGNGTPPDETP